MNKIKLGRGNFGWSSYFICLGLLLIAFLCPIVPQASKATEAYKLSGAATIAVSVGEEVILDIEPSATGTFGSAITDVMVSTNNQSGYSLYFGTLDQTNSLVNVSSSDNAGISAISTHTSGNDFQANTWGYALTDATDSPRIFAPVPLYDTVPILQTSNSTTDHYRLTIAANIDTALPAGQYSNNLMISAIANPTTISTLQDLVYFQDMTPEICANTGNIEAGQEVTKQLIDIRDNQEYWVAKMADQECWMTQNLALNIDAEKGLSMNDSDINYPNTVWSVEHPGTDITGTTKIVPADTSFDTSPTTKPSYKSTNSYNLGKWILAIPNANEFCSNVLNHLSECSNLYLDVSDVTKWRPTFTAQAGTWNGKTYDYVTVKLDNAQDVSAGGEYDAHYLTGNYYQWNTAVAGSAGDFDGSRTRMPDSICPKGWKMPALTGEGSLWQLVQHYGFTGDSFTGMKDGQIYSLDRAPLYVMASGYVYPSSPDRGQIREGGINFGFMTPYTWQEDDSYNFTSVAYVLPDQSVFQGGIAGRYNAFDMRCVAK